MTLHQPSSTAGLRRTTRNTRSAQQLARQYDTYSGQREKTDEVCRIRALQVAKRVAAELGLKSTKIALIDLLFGFTKPFD